MKLFLQIKQWQDYLLYFTSKTNKLAAEQQQLIDCLSVCLNP